MKFVRIAAVLLVMAGVAHAASNPFGMINSFSRTSSVPVDIQAPSMDFEQGGKRIIASGGVTVSRVDEKLTCDSMVYDKTTDQAEAVGHVVLTKTNMVWRGERVVYCFRDGSWKTSGFDAKFAPFRMGAQDAARTNDYFMLNRAEITTCTNEPGHYHYAMRCKRIRVYPGDHFVARHMVIRFGGIPMFYLPYWYCSLNDRSVGTAIQAGYRSRMGAFVLTSTKYWMTANLRGVTHVDYRTERGAALGQEVGWVTDDNKGKGRIYAYATDDQRVERDFTSGHRNELIDSQRYRLSLGHTQEIGPRDYFLSDFTYLSDAYVLEDFFEREFRNSFQPQNYATYIHRNDNSSFTLSAYKRLNDFYEGVDRLPEAGFDVQRVQVADSPIYYESKNSGGFLQRLFPDGSGQEDYSSARFDTLHEFYWPTRHFGFLNVTPRVGYEGTFYSDTVLNSMVTQVVTTATTNSTGATVFGTKTNISSVATAMGGDLRSLFNIGFETSFRAFKVLDNEENTFGTGLRHVLEPYTDYTFMPEPNIRPGNLYQFDEIDRLDKRNDLRFGVRNRLQTKRNQTVMDIIDFDLFTTYSFEEENQDEPFSVIGFRGEFNLADWCRLYSDGTYNLYDSRIETFNTQARMKSESWRANLEQRYRVEESHLLLADVSYAPNKRWEYGIYDRFELEDSRLEEQGVTLTRTYDCMVVSFGGSFLPGYTRTDGSVREDDYRLMFQLWFTAFPNVRLGSSRRE